MVTYDPYDQRQRTEGTDHELLVRVRAEAPVCPMPVGGWYLARQEELLAALRDVHTFRAEKVTSQIADPRDDSPIPDAELFLSEIAEPRHGEVRRVYNTILGPHRVRQLEPLIRELAHGLLEPLRLEGQRDLVADFTTRLPSMVIAELLGVPVDDADTFVRWCDEGLLNTRFGVETDGQEPAIHRYVDRLLTERRAQTEPPADAVTALMTAQVEGAPLSDVEIRTQVQFIVLAGVGTTKALLGEMFQILLQDPELYARVRAERDLVGRVVEETLRHHSPVQATKRRATADATLGGVEIRKGDWVVLGIASANRDEAVYDDPASFSLDRPEPREHMAFGGGPHVCPGASLARLEANVALQVFLDLFSEIAPVEGASYDRLPATGIDLPATLVVRATPAR